MPSPSVVRAFIGIDLPPEIQRCLEQVTTQLRQRLEGVPVRWVPAEKIHITLKFLGDVSVANIDMLKKIMKSVAPAHQAFEISVGGLGAFPKPHDPRVIWVGLEIPPELVVVRHGIETEAARLGYTQEERPFSPHLTLGRVSRNASTSDIHKNANVLETYKVGFLGAVRVEAIHLYRSDLKPGGAIYTRLFSVPFGV